MERQCPACGARVSNEMKICGNCGKILPQRRTSSSQANASNVCRRSPQQRVNTARAAGAAVNNANTAKSREQQAKRSVQRSAVQREIPRQEPTAAKNKARKAQSHKQKDMQSIWQRFNIKKWLKVAVVVIIIYAVVSAAQIFRVRFSTYEFKTTDMKMSRDDYGQAIDGFFDSGHWIYNPFTFTVKYSGKSEGKEYVLKFSAFASVDLKSVEVDGDKKDGDNIEPIIMGMFI